MRKPRILVAGARYHIVARTNRKEFRLDGKYEKLLFIEILRKAKKRYDFSIENFTVMGNHFHLIIRPTGKAVLSRIMQWIMGVFAMTYNRIFGLTGHFWGQRFFSAVISSLKEYLHAYSYIDDNAVKANIVIDPWEWEYGGLDMHRRAMRDFLEPPTDLILLFFPEHAIRMLTDGLIPR